MVYDMIIVELKINYTQIGTGVSPAIKFSIGLSSSPFSVRVGVVREGDVSISKKKSYHVISQKSHRTGEIECNKVHGVWNGCLDICRNLQQ